MQLGRGRHIWEDNIKIDSEEKVCECVNWIQWLRMEFNGGQCKHCNESSDSIKVWNSLMS
jgi:Zn finger protein HypA/HybF involved in hydrogenase expression